MMNTGEQPLVTFVLPTYNRVLELRSTLSALLCQTDKNWEAIVVIDGLDYSDQFRDMIKSITDINEYRIRVLYLDKRYNDWGHTPRELGKQQARGRYVIMSGDDNYYVPTFVAEFTKAMLLHMFPGMIYWDMVHSHYNYQYFVCTPGFNQIDMGAFATRTDLAKQLPLGTEYAADGLYVENFKHMFPNEQIIKINKVLYVHN